VKEGLTLSEVVIWALTEGRQYAALRADFDQQLQELGASMDLTQDQAIRAVMLAGIEALRNRH
jgi:hypothetical protein